MTIDEAKKMLKAKLECLKHETSGTDYACNQHLCEGCSLNYEQGNMGEQKEALEMAIKALEQQPKRGHWICHRDHCENLGVIPSGLGVYEWCSNCDCGIDIREWQKNHYNFCPNCGADMREGEDANNSQYTNR